MALDDLLERVNALASSGLVEFAHPDFRIERISYSSSNDPLYPNQWHLESTGLNGSGVDEDIDAEGAWAVTRGTARRSNIFEMGSVAIYITFFLPVPT